MNIDKEIDLSSANIRSIIEKEMPEMDKFFNEQAISASPELLKGLKQFIDKNRLGIIEGELKLSVILDTNTLFSCVYRKFVKGTESILVNIAKNPFIQIYYSDYVKEELISIIKRGKLKAKNKNISVEEGIEYGLSLLEGFERIPDEDIIEHPDSNALQERDPKDVPIINSTCSKQNHGILSNDNDFETMKNEIKIWSIPDIGKSTCMLNKGSLSLFLSDLSINIIKEILKLIVQVIKEVFKFIANSFKLIIKGLASLPKEFYLVLGAITLMGIIAYFSTETNKKIDKLSEDIDGFLNKTSERFKNLISKIQNLLKIIENSDEVKSISKGAGYLALTSLELLIEVDRLERIAIDYTKES